MRRVPFFIVIPSSIAVAIFSWWLGVRHYDFLTPPSPEKIYALEQSLKARSETYDVFKSAPAPPPEKIEPIVIEPPTPPPPTRIALGDVKIAPGLDEYTAAAQQGQDYLAKLAEALEEEGYPGRALIAWERMLDSTPAPPTVHQQAAAAITRIRPTLPPWTIDPSEQTQLELSIGATIADPASLASALDIVCSDIENATSGLLSVRPQLNLSEDDPGDRSLPIALWLAYSDNPDAASSILTFPSDLTDVEKTTRSTAATVYELVRLELEQIGGFLPLPALSKTDQPREILRSRITRLQWLRFAEALIRNSEIIAAPADVIE